MGDTSDLRHGLVINFRDELWTVVEFQHVKPGKGVAFVRTKLKNVKTGRVVENTFRS
ncbi:MAG: elongation factor P, partial [bacterium]